MGRIDFDFVLWVGSFLDWTVFNDFHYRGFFLGDDIGEGLACEIVHFKLTGLLPQLGFLFLGGFLGGVGLFLAEICFLHVINREVN